MAAFRAGCARFRAHRRSARRALCLAQLAAFGIVPELLVMKEKLFPGGEYKFIPAIHTFENLVDELHTRSPAGLQRDRRPAQSP